MDYGRYNSCCGGCLRQILQDGKRTLVDRFSAAQGAHIWTASEKGCRCEIFADAFHHDEFGCSHFGGLNIVSKTAGNVVVESALIKTRQNISEGRTIAEPLSETGIFPPMVVQMIAVGEATGALDTMLSKIADFYDDEVDAAVAAMTALLEPIMMVFLGGVVGGMIIAMYLPIFKMASVVG